MSQRFNTIHCCTTGQIDPEDSLFTYPPGLSTTDFSVPDHEPAFLNEVITGAPQEVLEACDGDARCIYDASQTRNIAVGQETMRQDSSNMLNQALAGKTAIAMGDSRICSRGFPGSFVVHGALARRKFFIITTPTLHINCCAYHDTGFSKGHLI